jgi:hypothetical protein
MYKITFGIFENELTIGTCYGNSIITFPTIKLPFNTKLMKWGEISL